MRRLRETNINSPEDTNKKYKWLGLDEPSESEQAKRMQMVEGLEEGMKVVELGCGISSFCQTLKDKFPNCEVHALDFGGDIIERLKINYPQIKYKRGDATKTPYEDNYFDYVVAGELIEHIPDPEDLVKEMYRICKNGGVISISTPFLERMWRPNDIPAEHLWEFNRDDMHGLFSKYGETKTRFFIDKVGVGGIHMVVNCICQK